MHKGAITDKENVAPQQVDMSGMATITQKQFSGKHKEITEEQRKLINELTEDPFILDEDRADIEQFISRFPLLWKSYIPVSIIGEGTLVVCIDCVGTFSTVYKAIDVQHFDMDNEHWRPWSRQDPEDAPRLLAFVQRLMEGWSAYFASGNQTAKSEVERKDHLTSFSNLNMSIKNYVHEYVRRLLSMQYDGSSPTPTCPPISPHFVALKRINPTSSPERLIDEISFLKELGGRHNVVPVISGMRYQDQVIVVFPYFYSSDFREYLTELSPMDISCYMRLMFEALAHIHSHSIIHRDIKPSNFLFSPEDRRAVLVDFGLAQREGQDEHVNANNNSKSKLKQEDMEKQVALLKEKLAKLPPGVVVNDNRPAMKASRAGTRGFRAPEVLFKHAQQTCSIDVWSAGVILLTLLTRRYPFFQSSDDQDAIVEIACLFGNEEMAEAAKRYHRQWTCDVPTVPASRIGWKELVKGMNPEGFKVLPEEAFDLLDQCLRLDVDQRVTARQALEHPFIKMSL